MEEPFGRQPLPVTISIIGEPEDVAYWKRALMQRGESHGDMVQSISDMTFKIYPRAVND